jgi:hypothetical protein
VITLRTLPLHKSILIIVLVGIPKHAFCDTITRLGSGAVNTKTAGVGNTGLGSQTLNVISADGIYNTAVGYSALQNDVNGKRNTALGSYTLTVNNNGDSNTAVGYKALNKNTTASQITAIGTQALASNTTGASNTAVGYNALAANTTGGNNIAMGNKPLFSNLNGGANIALGNNALLYNTTGNYNTALGNTSLRDNNGDDNTAIGYIALSNNMSGSQNIAVGNNTLLSNISGSNNIALGYDAGSNLLYDYNICIGHEGVSSDDGVIRIGTEGSQSTSYIAGIRGVTTDQNDAIAVMIDSNGQLGTVSSSRRYKQDIEPIAKKQIDALHTLQPVSFTYKKHGAGSRNYGLIAEEVAEVMPELVIYNKDNQPETVRYNELAPLLLKAYQNLDDKVDNHQTTLKAIDEYDIPTLIKRLVEIEATLALLQK